MNNLITISSLILLFDINIDNEELFLINIALTENPNMDLISILLIVLLIITNTNNGINNTENLLIVIFVSVIVMFSTASLVVLFLSFEASIVPIMLIITKTGQYPENGSASVFIIVITIISSMPALVCISNAVKLNESNSIINASNNSNEEEYLIAILILLFITKLPAIVIHIWLPKAHVQAPTPGSIVLAGVILNIGGYGILISSNINNHQENNVIITLGITGMILSAIISMRQTDLNTIVAYSSVSHISILLSNIASNSNSMEGTSIIGIISHALCSPIIFIFAGIVSDTYNTNNIIITNNLNKTSGIVNVLWIMVCASNISTPPAVSFIMEVIMLINILKNNTNSVSLVGILMIAILCITIATAPMTVNSNENNINNEDISLTINTTWTLIVIVITSTATENLS